MIYNSLAEKISNFSELPKEECAELLKTHLLEALETDTSLEWEMVSSFIVITYPEREPLRIMLNTAIRSNEQLLGNYTVKQWLDRYRRIYNNIERSPDTFYNFVTQDTETKKLDKINQMKLMKIYRIYDYLLVKPIFELSDVVMSMIRFPMRIPQTNISQQIYSTVKSGMNREIEKPIAQKLESMKIAEALVKFPKLGEQLITSSALKLRYFPNPVRPSIKNWITDYQQTLGTVRHSSIERSNYIFNNANTRSLPNSDKQRLSDIFKSLDEDMPLSVNPQAQQVVFTASVRPPEIVRPQSPNSMPNRPRGFNPMPSRPQSYNPLPTRAQNISQPPVFHPQTQAPSPKPEEPIHRPENISRENLVKNNPSPAPDENIRFSSPQKLPYEKMKAQPYRITPIYGRVDEEPDKNDDKPLGKNIVDLRNP